MPLDGAVPKYWHGLPETWPSSNLLVTTWHHRAIARQTDESVCARGYAGLAAVAGRTPGAHSHESVSHTWIRRDTEPGTSVPHLFQDPRCHADNRTEPPYLVPANCHEALSITHSSRRSRLRMAFRGTGDLDQRSGWVFRGDSCQSGLGKTPSGCKTVDRTATQKRGAVDRYRQGFSWSGREDLNLPPLAPFTDRGTSPIPNAACPDNC